MLKWVVADPDSDLTDSFTLEANGAALDTLEYLVPNFKLVETEVAFFDATIYINRLNYKDKPVHFGNFEWRAGTLSHKIAEKIQDETVKSVSMEKIKHSSVVTSEALSVISKLYKPDTGFEKIEFWFGKLNEKVSETVVDQFVLQAKHL